MICVCISSSNDISGGSSMSFCLFCGAIRNNKKSEIMENVCPTVAYLRVVFAIRPKKKHVMPLLSESAVTISF